MKLVVVCLLISLTVLSKCQEIEDGEPTTPSNSEQNGLTSASSTTTSPDFDFAPTSGSATDANSECANRGLFFAMFKPVVCFFKAIIELIMGQADPCCLLELPQFSLFK